MGTPVYSHEKIFMGVNVPISQTREFPFQGNSLEHLLESYVSVSVSDNLFENLAVVIIFRPILFARGVYVNICIHSAAQVRDTMHPDTPRTLTHTE